MLCIFAHYWIALGIFENDGFPNTKDGVLGKILIIVWHIAIWISSISGFIVYFNMVQNFQFALLVVNNLQNTVDLEK